MRKQAQLVKFDFDSYKTKRFWKSMKLKRLQIFFKKQVYLIFLHKKDIKIKLLKLKSKFIKGIPIRMGTQQSNPKSAISSQIKLPQPGYRITNLDPSINAQQFKLNIMTDYVIGNDPRFLDLKKLHQLNRLEVQFEVFSILDYRIRRVNIPIQKHQVQPSNQVSNANKEDVILMEQQKKQGFTLNSNKQFSLGINFKLYPRINDTILRISKVFKNSPLQVAQIRKDQYIVGLIEGDFTSMKSFVDLVKLLIHSQFQYITLAICNLEGITRLQKITVKELQKWKQNYGIGYLGVQLAEGWLNKWQLKKHLDLNKKKLLDSKINPKTNVQKIVNQEAQALKEFDKLQTKQSLSRVQESQTLKKELTIVQIKEQVDFLKQKDIISPKKEKNQGGFTKPKQLVQQKLISSRVEEASIQLGLKSTQSLENTKQQQQKQMAQFSKVSNQIEQGQDTNSEISSNQIDEKCNELEQGSYESRKREMSVIKKSKNIMQINFKDDASTICMCKDYSKHCEKCFKEKQGNYLFFNKKTNRIILIEKALLFPKKN